MSDRAQQLIDRYLSDLRRELGDLPRRRRDDLVEDIRAHIRDSLAETGRSESAVRTVLDDIGDPREIANEMPGRREVTPVRFSTREALALVLLPLGGYVLFVGWWVGVALLWTTDGWSTREKLAGTFLPPGGLLFAHALHIASIGDADAWQVSAFVLAAIGLVLAISVPLYLAVVLRRRARGSRREPVDDGLY